MKFNIAATRGRAAKDLGQMSRPYNQEVFITYDDIRERWGVYLKWLMNDENTEIEQKGRDKSRNDEYDL